MYRHRVLVHLTHVPVSATEGKQREEEEKEEKEEKEEEKKEEEERFIVNSNHKHEER